MKLQYRVRVIWILKKEWIEKKQKIPYHVSHHFLGKIKPEIDENKYDYDSAVARLHELANGWEKMFGRYSSKIKWFLNEDIFNFDANRIEQHFWPDDEAVLLGEIIPATL